MLKRTSFTIFCLLCTFFEAYPVLKNIFITILELICKPQNRTFNSCEIGTLNTRQLKQALGLFRNHENHIKYCTFQTEAYILVKLIEIQSKRQKLLI